MKSSKRKGQISTAQNQVKGVTSFLSKPLASLIDLFLYPRPFGEFIGVVRACLTILEIIDQLFRVFQVGQLEPCITLWAAVLPPPEVLGFFTSTRDSLFHQRFQLPFRMPVSVYRS
jgi:hypothetical protein